MRIEELPPHAQACEYVQEMWRLRTLANACMERDGYPLRIHENEDGTAIPFEFRQLSREVMAYVPDPPEPDEARVALVSQASERGEVCPNCGSSQLRWTGTCKVCASCGSGGGCE